MPDLRTLFIAAALALAALAYQAQARGGSGPLDGTAWDVKLKQDSFFSRSRRDTLIFDRGSLSVAGSLASGFRSGAYAAEGAGPGGRTLWTSSLRQDGGSVLSWQGVAQGDRIEGTLLLQPQVGRVKRFSFKGKLRPPTGS